MYSKLCAPWCACRSAEDRVTGTVESARVRKCCFGSAEVILHLVSR